MDFQLALSPRGLPAENIFRSAVCAAIAGQRERASLTMRVVARAESRRLNQQFRNVDAPTNVLSFEAQGLEELLPDYIGDVVICAPVARAESDAQGKSCGAHISHLVVHGVLHLLGFDHIDDHEEEIMEARERAILSGLGIANPYQP